MSAHAMSGEGVRAEGTGSGASSGDPAGGRAARSSRGGGLQRVLGLPATVMFGLAYMLPLTVFTTFGIVNQLTEGHIIAAYVVTLVAMMFTATSYARMAGALPVAGSAYTYAKESMGPGVGFMTGWTLLLDYLLMPLLTYLVIGLYMAEAFPAVPRAVWIVGSAVLVTAVNVVGITLVSKASIVLLSFQVVFLLVFAVMSVRAASGNPLPSVLDVLAGHGPGMAAVMAGAAILCLSFLGFDAVSSLAEETVDAKRVIPRAIILVTLCGGVLFIVISFLANYVFPDFTAYADPDSAGLEIAHAAGGDFLSAFFTAAYIAGCFGAVLASQSTVSRILFSMGRDGQLPRRVFGHLHPRFHTPARSCLVVGAIGACAVFFDLDVIASMISFGALVAFTAVNLSVVKYHFLDRGRRRGGDLLRYLVVPLLGVGMCLWLWTSLSPTSLVVGVAWALVGLVYLAVLTRGFRVPPPVLNVSEAAADDEAGGRAADTR